MPEPRIRRYDSSEEFYLDEGCFIRELANTAEDPEVSIAEARVPPGVTTEWHRLQGITERYLITSGCGMVEVGDIRAREVGSGDVVWIPPGCRQRIHNPGPDDLVFLAICSPRFLPEAYESLED